jgi:hypothetical protein
MLLCCRGCRLDVPASAKVVDASFAAGQCWLGLPGSVHQIYTAKGGEGCMLLMLYSKVLRCWRLTMHESLYNCAAALVFAAEATCCTASTG